ncbi:MAG: SDR family oxidoreductase [Acuticoccus sp.]
MTAFAIHPGLKDKTVLITGGATGIGEAHVRAFHGQGARVAFIDIAEDEGKALAAALAKEPGHAPLFFKADLTDLSALAATLDAIVEEMGDVEVLINNAANDTRHTLAEVTEESFNDNIAVNLRHFVFTSQRLIPGMQRMGRGAIVNFGSITWRAAMHGLPLYAMAKAGIEGLTRALASEFGKDRIRVNCVVPGWVMTERQLRLWVDATAEEKINTNQCLPDRVQPEDLARMAVFLASEDSRMCTAQTFIVDGGWL